MYHASSPDGIGLRLSASDHRGIAGQMLKKSMFTSFIRVGCRSSNQASGSVSHDLTREVLTADLRWRNPDWYAELHRRARSTTLHAYSKPTVKSSIVYYSIIFLHRDNPAIRPVSHGKRTVAC